ncbi:hypothetical protein BASA50_001209 [Batrachochytrium salamandrivorans]|uniref:Histone-binding protein RBBP4 N-terminal domain-containing protein n=1 Tax=Batrachochytrium salamandrivorans TaxID=1357716 RepID=A0ABQ8ESY9_9FUNG|nr:hypothetical protein BASA62_005377 [Batrachochytrium salamandrivorans]KAH6582942.1 hypothetical protein BASA60_001691 [Batrachochytrium salamandrivorans]KAH6585113.1 hypothetical protein BASA61_007084 [Batrachochytrium salamandrivorans]KAH6585305.1 hypothetical protein BASA61_006923 [Batrachochytrium salamandrivorans]KAH6585601.1 hypothetical protein BASA50_001209 [Batrachochytrium salamandrivorans]
MSQRSEVHQYKAPFPVYSLHWSQRPNAFRLGISSFIESSNNKLQIIQLFNNSSDFVKIAEVDHTFPVTKLMWSPQKGMGPDLFSTSGDYLRLWELVTSDEAIDAEMETNISENNMINDQVRESLSQPEQRQIICRATLANHRKVPNSKKEYCAPLTSFDWNEIDPSLCVTSSVDTTCTVWDVRTQQAKTQLIAHDKEVYDVAFSKGVHVFASVGADGSVRMFDLRALDHSTIIYETPAPSSAPSSEGSKGSTGSGSLLRISWNKQDPSYLATFQQDSNSVLILDVRVPAIPVTELRGHTASISSIGWAPHSSGHICTAGEDGQALVWDISQMPKQKYVREPLLAYSAGSEINNMSWSAVSPDWVAISHKDTIQALRV